MKNPLTNPFTKLITLFFLTLATWVTAQNESKNWDQPYKNEIAKEFSAYTQAIVDRKFDVAAEYIHPDFFEILPKKSIISLMEMPYKMPNIEIEIVDPKVLSVGDAEQVEDRYYAMITYSNLMKIKVGTDEPETAEEKAERMRLLKMSYQNKFGADNVHYNEETEFFEILITKKVIAISDDGQTGWKVIEGEKKQKSILGKVIPKEILGKI
jgi:hypothetical protein